MKARPGDNTVRRNVSKKKAISEIMQCLRRIFKSIQQYSEEVLKEFGVTGPQLWLLKSLERGEASSIGELSQKMFLHISTVSGIVDRLEDKGYVVRKKEGPDRRVVTVHLTDTGKRIVARSPEPSQGKLLYGLENLPLKEVLEIHDALKKIAHLMEVEHIKVRFFFSEE